MGLLYPFPATAEETDFISLDGTTSVTLRTYGLPYLFWGYAAASLTVVFFLWLAVSDSLTKLYNMGDSADQMLVRSLQTLLVGITFTTIAFFFYEKRLHRSGSELRIEHRLFWIPVWRKTLQLNRETPFSIRHFMDAPNVARMKSDPESIGFQNKGYFTLWAHTSDGKETLLDRHSRKVDLVGLMGLLSLTDTQKR